MAATEATSSVGPAPPASLRLRVMAALLAAFLVALPAGAAMSLWQGRISVATELNAALSAETAAARSAMQETPRLRPERLVDRFEGARHVQVSLLDGRGAVVRASSPRRPTHPPPAWFVRLLDPGLAPAPVETTPSVPGAARLVVTANPANEAAEVWNSYRSSLLVSAVFGLVALATVLPALILALRPLSSVSSALSRVTEGDYGVRVPERGSRETLELSRGFNAMAEELERTTSENRRLQAQLLTLQEEERGELARDLHDEVGPYLFAIEIDATAATDVARAKGWREVETRTELIAAAVSHVQGHVRDMLARLRPARAVELGLAGAIDDLMSFWRARRPAIDFRLYVEADESCLGPAQREVVYRVVQEALSNAVRHGRPTRIEVGLHAGVDGSARLEVRDDGGGPGVVARGGRHGLLGMQERVSALDGELSVVQGPDGWRVMATLPASSGQAEEARATCPS